MALQIRTEVHPPQAHIVFTIDKNRPPRELHIENSLLRFFQKQVLSYTSIMSSGVDIQMKVHIFNWVPFFIELNLVI